MGVAQARSAAQSARSNQASQLNDWSDSGRKSTKFKGQEEDHHVEGPSG